ncbi:MAG: hypothetical protein AAGK78_10770, partial [Planctomycetota bacterium]
MAHIARESNEQRGASMSVDHGLDFVECTHRSEKFGRPIDHLLAGVGRGVPVNDVLSARRDDGGIAGIEQQLTQGVLYDEARRMGMAFGLGERRHSHRSLITGGGIERIHHLFKEVRSRVGQV